MTNTRQCCEKCRLKDTTKISSCLYVECPCHSPKSPTEEVGWEKRFDEKPWGITRAINSLVGDRIEGFELSARDEIKSFIHSEIEKAMEEGFKEGVEKAAKYVESWGTGHGRLSLMASEIRSLGKRDKK